MSSLSLGAKGQVAPVALASELQQLGVARVSTGPYTQRVAPTAL